MSRGINKKVLIFMFFISLVFAGGANFAIRSFASTNHTQQFAIGVKGTGKVKDTTGTDGNTINCPTSRCKYSYAAKSATISNKAIPSAGYTFDKWKLEKLNSAGKVASTTYPTSTTVKLSRSYSWKAIAYFKKRTITHKFAKVGSGTVASTVAANGVSCGADCSQAFAYYSGTRDYKASPATGYKFTGWDKNSDGKVDVSPVSTVIRLKTTSNYSVKAIFVKTATPITPPPSTPVTVSPVAECANEDAMNFGDPLPCQFESDSDDGGDEGTTTTTTTTPSSNTSTPSGGTDSGESYTEDSSGDSTEPEGDADSGSADESESSTSEANDTSVSENDTSSADEGTNESATSEGSSDFGDETLAAPTNPKAVFSEGDGTISVSWDGSVQKGKTFFEVQRQEKGKPDWQSLGAVAASPFSDFAFAPQKSYLYQVRTGETEGGYSPWSESAEATSGAFRANVASATGGVVTDSGNTVSVNLPGGAASQDLAVRVSKIEAAGLTLPENVMLVGSYYQIQAKDAQGNPVSSFNRQVVIKLKYQGINAFRFKKSSIVIMSSEDGKTLQKMPTKLDGAEASTLSNHFSYYFLAAEKNNTPALLVVLVAILLASSLLVLGVIGLRKKRA